jgi:hypothetical protein
VLGAFVQDDPSFRADLPEEAFEQDGELVKPGG